MSDLEASRKRTYYSCWNDEHKNRVYQTFFTEPDKYIAKCPICGAIMTSGRYSDIIDCGILITNDFGIVLHAE